VAETHRRPVKEAERRAVYLAGPAGFSDSGRLWHETVLVPAVLAAGLVPKDPWAGPSPITDVLESLPYGHELREALQAANLKQGRIDLDLVDQSEAVLACLDGPDVDSGTAVEVGYAFARHKLIVGLRTDIRRSADNDGSLVNLMVETCIFDSGGILTASIGEAVAYLSEKLGPEA
jgi:nucleoside 2-deoxyribosyltransferase